MNVLETIPDLPFQGADGTVKLSSYYEPCVKSPHLLVVRVGAPWCGTCEWHAQHTKEIFDAPNGSRVRILDLLLADRDNFTPTVSTITSWRSTLDAPVDVALDPSFQLAPLNATFDPLPLIVFIDTKTMRVQSTLHNPGPDLLKRRIAQELASIDGLPQPVATPEETFDTYFTRNQWDMLHAMTLPGAPPSDPTNKLADDPNAAALGKALFADTSLSPSGTVACATCHDSAKGFSDGLPQAKGVANGDRHSPSLLLASHSRWQFWDGRADSLWMQATGPFENDLEFASSRLFVAHQIDVNYKSRYEALWGPLPALGDASRFPAEGKPGSASWQAMAPADQEAVSRVYANVAKSIAAFERTLRPKPNRVDAYVAGDQAILTSDEKHAAHEFFVAGCAQCHFGPRLTNDAFHNVRFPTGRRDGAADVGRSQGITDYLGSEFRAGSAFSDAPVAINDDLLRASAPKAIGQFKTPSLRGMQPTGPFGHGGTLATFEAVVKNYGEHGLAPEKPEAVGTAEPWLPKFTEDHQTKIVQFLKLLTEAIAP